MKEESSASRKGRKTKKIGTYGRHGCTIRVYKETASDRVFVQWRDGGVRRTESFRGERAVGLARDRAETLERLPLGAGRVVRALSVRALWEAYSESPQFLLETRPATQRLYREAWRLWSLVTPEELPADVVNAETFSAAREALGKLHSPRRQPYAVATIKSALMGMKAVFAWGARYGRLKENRAAQYRFKRREGEEVMSPGEYTAEEFRALLVALKPPTILRSTSRDAIALLGYQGVRARAAVHLRWEDIDWDRRRITWRAKWDKAKKEWTQPMREPTVALLRARREALKPGATGWVFPGSRRKRQLGKTGPTVDDAYTVQGLWDALMQAEKHANIPHRPYRAMHGLRRMVAGDVEQQTGSVVRAMRAIGDEPSGLAKRYLLRREDDAAEGLRTLDDRDAASDDARAEDDGW